MDQKEEALKRRGAGKEEPAAGPLGRDYCPISLGQSLGPDAQTDAYRIERKLGWGACSTIWLAFDTRCGDYVALKVMTASVTKCMVAKKRNQIPFFIAIDGKESVAGGTKPNISHPGREHCMHLLEAFIIDREREGQKVEHAVCAFEVLGADLADFRRNYVPPRVPIRLVKLIAKQILHALDYIHEECGIIHCDLRPDNILLRLGPPALARETIESLLKMVEPEFDEDDGRPISQSLMLQSVYDEDDIFVKLADFGNATWKDQPHRLPTGPLAYRSPEGLLGLSDFGSVTDIWSLGCIVFELIVGERMFDHYECGDGVEEQQAIDTHLHLIRDYSGQSFPLYLREGSLKGPQFLDERCKPIGRRHSHTPSGLRDVLNRDDIFSESTNELDQVEAFIKRCLTIDPRYRPTAIELLRDAWLERDE